MSDSKYGAVHFMNRELYAADAPIVCRFVYANCQPDDVVAIKKIGWKADELQTSLVSVSAADAVVDTPAGNIMRVTFQPASFSGLRTENELFQFCYISGAVLHGASTSFSIIRPKEGDYADLSHDAEVNDDDGFVVLKSPQAQFQDKIEQLQTELNSAEEVRSVLNEKVQLLEKERSKLTQENASIRQERDSAAAEVEAARQKEQKLEQTLEEAISNHTRNEKEMTATLDNEKKKRQEIQKGFQETSDELTRVRADNAELRKERDDLSRRRREDEKFCAANEVMMKVLKEEVQHLEHEKSVANAERDFAASSLLREMDQRKQDKEDSRAQEALLQRTVDELKLRLEKAAEEYQEKYKYGVKLESKLQRLREKIDQFRTTPKSRSTSESAANASQPQDSIAEASAVMASDLVSKSEETGDVSLPCSICREDVLCTVRDLRQMVNHLEESHQQLVCPVCSQMFDKTIPGIDSYFHCHVENHFDAVRYPKSS